MGFGAKRSKNARRAGARRTAPSDLRISNIRATRARGAGVVAIHQNAKAATAWTDVSSYAASRLGHDRPAPFVKLSNPATADDRNCKAKRLFCDGEKL